MLAVCFFCDPMLKLFRPLGRNHIRLRHAWPRPASLSRRPESHQTADLYRGAGGRIMTAAHSGECAGHRTHDVIEIYLECAVWDVRIQHKPI